MAGTCPVDVWAAQLERLRTAAKAQFWDVIPWFAGVRHHVSSRFMPNETSRGDVRTGLLYRTADGQKLTLRGKRRVRRLCRMRCRVGSPLWRPPQLDRKACKLTAAWPTRRYTYL